MHELQVWASNLRTGKYHPKYSLKKLRNLEHQSTTPGAPGNWTWYGWEGVGTSVDIFKASEEISHVSLGALFVTGIKRNCGKYCLRSRSQIALKFSSGVHLLLTSQAPAQLKPFWEVRQKLHNFSSVGAERPNAIRVANLQYHDTLSS